MNAPKILAAFDAIESANAAAQEQHAVLRRELALWRVKVDALRSAVNHAQTVIDAEGFGPLSAEPPKRRNDVTSRILAALADNSCRLGDLALHVYGVSTHTSRRGVSVALDRLRKDGAVENAGRGWWRLTQKGAA